MNHHKIVTVKRSEAGFRWKRLFDSQPDYMYRRRLLKTQANSGSNGANSITNDRTSGQDPRDDGFAPLLN